jgi:acetyl esterase/lipase
MKRVLIWISTSLFSVIIIIVLAFILSPRPAAYLVQQLFKQGVAVAPPNYADYEEAVTVINDLHYPSQFKENTLDLISPKDSEQHPVIIWIHGGAFVGGDKKDITEYAVMLAANGYHVVNANYELAPSAKYPTPLKQLDEIYQYVQTQATTYNFNMDEVYFAGDSAGAQIVSQYGLIQSNPSYAAQLGFEQTVPLETIKGLLLYCGPFDIAKLSHLSDNKLVAFLLGRVGWAYIGEKDWVHSETAKFASTMDYVTADYPRTFITDGNDMTFTEHGQELATALEHLNVEVQTKFYTREQQVLPHEYQFIFDYEEAYETFDATIDFLK